MSQHIYNTKGTCSSKITFELTSDDKIKDLSFLGGCNGNLKAISALCEGLSAEEAVKRLSGITCGTKGTSCADQLSAALKEAAKTSPGKTPL